MKKIDLTFLIEIFTNFTFEIYKYYYTYNKIFDFILNIETRKSAKIIMPVFQSLFWKHLVLLFFYINRF